MLMCDADGSSEPRRPQPRPSLVSRMENPRILMWGLGGAAAILSHVTSSEADLRPAKGKFKSPSTSCHLWQP